MFCENYPQYYPASLSTSSETTTEAFISYMMDRWITLNGYYYMDNLVLGGWIYFLLLALDQGALLLLSRPQI
jgi:hypothetical protein